MNALEAKRISETKGESTKMARKTIDAIIKEHATRGKTCCSVGELSVDLTRELKADGYKVEPFDDIRDSNGTNISW